jgi:hypothetical protein
VLVATISVVACVGYGRIKRGQGIGAVGALAYRGSHVSEDGQDTVNAPRSPSETGERMEIVNGKRKIKHILTSMFNNI